MKISEELRKWCDDLDSTDTVYTSSLYHLADRIDAEMVELPKDAEPHRALEQLKQLSEEDPALHIGWNMKTGEIEIQIMGQVHLLIPKR